MKIIPRFNHQPLPLPLPLPNSSTSFFFFFIDCFCFVFDLRIFWSFLFFFFIRFMHFISFILSLVRWFFGWSKCRTCRVNGVHRPRTVQCLYITVQCMYIITLCIREGKKKKKHFYMRPLNMISTLSASNVWLSLLCLIYSAWYTFWQWNREVE